MGKAGGTGGPCGSLVFLGHQGPGAHCTHSQGLGHIVGSLPQASIPLESAPWSWLELEGALGLLPQVLSSSGFSGKARLSCA